jgi:hypothetical protein
MAESNASLSSPADLVQRHKVCWEVWPLLSYDDAGIRKQVGFELDLFGVHVGEAPAPSASADQNLEVFAALQRIAEAVLPRAPTDVDCSIAVYDAAIHSSRRRHFREDVQLQITLFHKNDCDREMDDGEVESLRTIEEALRALGARKDAWHGS